MNCRSEELHELPYRGIVKYVTIRLSSVVEQVTIRGNKCQFQEKQSLRSNHVTNCNYSTRGEEDANIFVFLKF